MLSTVATIAAAFYLPLAVTAAWLWNTFEGIDEDLRAGRAGIRFRM